MCPRCSHLQPPSSSSQLPTFDFQLLISNFQPLPFTFRLTRFPNYAMLASVILRKLLLAPVPKSFPGTLLSPSLALTHFSAHSYSFRPPLILPPSRQSKPLFSYSSAFSSTRFFHSFRHFSSSSSFTSGPHSHLPLVGSALVGGSSEPSCRAEFFCTAGFQPAAFSSHFLASAIAVIASNMHLPGSPACAFWLVRGRKSLPPTFLKFQTSLPLSPISRFISVTFPDFSRNPFIMNTCVFPAPHCVILHLYLHTLMNHSQRNPFTMNTCGSPPGGGVGKGGGGVGVPRQFSTREPI